MTDIYPLSNADVRSKLFWLRQDLEFQIHGLQRLRDTMSEEMLRTGLPTTDDMLISAKHFLEYALDTIKDTQKRYGHEH